MKLKITAAEGQQLKVTRQQPFNVLINDANGNASVQENWMPLNVDTFASEEREFVVDKGHRIIVEDNST